jgi:hypothetical protein
VSVVEYRFRPDNTGSAAMPVMRRDCLSTAEWKAFTGADAGARIREAVRRAYVESVLREYATMPSSTGTTPRYITTGMVEEAFFAAMVDGLAKVTISSTSRRTKSRASSSSSSDLPAAKRHSIARFFPSS